MRFSIDLQKALGRIFTGKTVEFLTQGDRFVSASLTRSIRQVLTNGNDHHADSRRCAAGQSVCRSIAS